MRHVVSSVTALLVMLAAISPVAARSGGPKVLLELFTSQGCSSCPPADALLPTFIARADVVALSFPVDYWDRLGWKDTLAKAEFTARQVEYARQRGDGQIYTPQIVVNGSTHVVGSREDAITEAVKRAQKSAPIVSLTLHTSEATNELVVALGVAPEHARVADAVVTLITARREAHVSVQRGENAHRELTYHNVVREVRGLGAWTGHGREWRLPIADLQHDAANMVVVLVQKGTNGPVLAVSQHALAP